MSLVEALVVDNRRAHKLPYRDLISGAHSRIVLASTLTFTEKETEMANIDLSSYNLSELKGLQHKIENEIKNRQQGDLAKARQQILAIAQAAGVTVEELLGAGTKKSNKGKGQKVQAQYQNPADKAQTWTGRGRQPKWIAEGIARGKQLSDFRI